MLQWTPCTHVLSHLSSYFFMINSYIHFFKAFDTYCQIPPSPRKLVLIYYLSKVHKGAFISSCSHKHFLKILPIWEIKICAFILFYFPLSYLLFLISLSCISSDHVSTHYVFLFVSFSFLTLELATFHHYYQLQI